MNKLNLVKYSILFSFLLLLIPSSIAIVDSFGLDEYLVTYEYDLNDAVIGEQFTLKITITNQDTEVHEDVGFELEENYPFEIIGDDDLKVDSLAPGESKSKSFRLEIDSDAKSDDYNIFFELEDDEGNDYNEPLELDVRSIDPDIIVGNVQSLPTVLSPDTEDIQLTITLENIGEGDANFLRAELELPEGFKTSSSYSDSSNLGTISAGFSKNAIFYIDTEKYIGDSEYTGELSIEYKDEDNNVHNKELEFDLPVKGKPQIKILDFKTTEKVHVGDQNNELRIELLNVGAEEGKETSVRVFENSDQPFEFSEKTNFIGNLNNGDTGTAVFSFDVDSGGNSNEYLLKVQIRTVNNGNVLVSEETIPIEVLPEESNTSTYVLISIIFIIIAITAFFSFRKFKKKDKKQTTL